MIGIPPKILYNSERELKMSKFAHLQSEELQRARASNKPMNSAHEGYTVILEEVNELWEEVRKNEKIEIHQTC